MRPDKSTDYVLGTHDEELERLGFQHQVWRAVACDQWERAGIRLGQRILDIGCGPGFTTLDLAAWTGPTGSVAARDLSPKFISHLQQSAAARGFHNIDAAVDNVLTMSLPVAHFDAAYTRWVLCFLPDPAAVIARVAAALKPGGVFAIQDYYSYEAICLSPPSDAFRTVIAATARSWREHGGDPNVAARLPALLHQHGLRIREVRPIIRSAHPGQMLWQWPTTFFRVYAPTLVSNGYLSEAEREAFDADWASHSQDPAACFVSPPMLDIIAEKRP